MTLSPTDVAGATTLTVDLTTPGADPAHDWLVTGTVDLFEAFRSLLEPAQTSDAVVLRFVSTPLDPDTDALAEAMFASVQAVVHSLAMEYPGARLTVVRTDPDQDEAFVETAAFLAGPDGAYVTASTLDLRSSR